VEKQRKKGIAKMRTLESLEDNESKFSDGGQRPFRKGRPPPDPTEGNCAGDMNSQRKTVEVPNGGGSLDGVVQIGHGKSISLGAKRGVNSGIRERNNRIL